MKKFFLVAAALFAFSVVSFAVDIVHIDLNYWCRGNLKLLTEKLPDGVKVSARKNYKPKKFAHICYYTIDVDLAKVQEISLEFEVVDTGDKDTASLKPSMSSIIAASRTFSLICSSGICLFLKPHAMLS